MRASRPTRQRDVALTVLTAVLVPGFLAMGYWQLSRALSGNALSWAYVFEWPLFAGYLLYVRWRLAREPAPAPATGDGVTAGAEPPSPAGTNGAAVADGQHREHGEDDEDDEDDEDKELAAYNRYLAALNESGRRKHW